LLDLFRAYRPEQVAEALQKALAARAFGADYVAHLLRQITSPRPVQPPLQLRHPELNQLATDPLSLLDYDALILEALRRLVMTLEEKLRQLTLTTMAQQMETITSQAAAQNLSFAAALERLADLELEARHGRGKSHLWPLSMTCALHSPR